MDWKAVQLPDGRPALTSPRSPIVFTGYKTMRKAESRAARLNAAVCQYFQDADKAKGVGR